MTEQIVKLFLLAIPIATVSWSVTHEYVFKELQDYCKARCTTECKPLIKRKVFYLFTCEYCFSHYVTAGALLLTRYAFPFAGWWIDYVLTGFALVLIANFYMGIYFRLRLSIKKIGAEAKIADAAAKALL